MVKALKKERAAFGGEMRSLRERLAKTPAQMAELLYISESCYQAIERGEVSRDALDFDKRIEDATRPKMQIVSDLWTRR